MGIFTVLPSGETPTKPSCHVGRVRVDHNGEKYVHNHSSLRCFYDLDCLSDDKHALAWLLAWTVTGKSLQARCCHLCVHHIHAHVCSNVASWHTHAGGSRFHHGQRFAPSNLRACDSYTGPAAHMVWMLTHLTACSVGAHHRVSTASCRPYGGLVRAAHAEGQHTCPPCGSCQHYRHDLTRLQ